MTDWQRTLNLLPEWQQAKSGEITPQRMAEVIQTRLLALRPFGESSDLDDERIELAEQFGDFARASEFSETEFDSLMDDLYDWADTPLDGHGDKVFDAKKACWIKTF